MDMLIDLVGQENRNLSALVALVQDVEMRNCDLTHVSARVAALQQQLAHQATRLQLLILERSLTKGSDRDRTVIVGGAPLAKG